VFVRKHFVYDSERGFYPIFLE